ncbi:hypothetical protein NL676_034695 [Syzygium grande]|nr:hypothetical protein NL676_034695 [Syzygium grande]
MVNFPPSPFVRPPFACASKARMESVAAPRTGRRPPPHPPPRSWFLMAAGVGLSWQCCAGRRSVPAVASAREVEAGSGLGDRSKFH